MQIGNCRMKIANLAGRSGGAQALRMKPLHPQSRYAKPIKLKTDWHFSVFSFHFSISLLCTLLFALGASVQAQTVPDKMVATVTNGSRATPDLITYSDLVWQLALEPGTPFSEKPTSANLNRALRTVEDQILILQEARKLPSADTPDAITQRDQEVQIRRDELAQAFGSAKLLQERMTRVGLSSEQLDLILRDRVTGRRAINAVDWTAVIPELR